MASMLFSSIPEKKSNAENGNQNGKIPDREKWQHLHVPSRGKIPDREKMDEETEWIRGGVDGSLARAFFGCAIPNKRSLWNRIAAFIVIGKCVRNVQEARVDPNLLDDLHQS